MTTTVKERPILYSGAMVRAILAGQKTQTRRVMKPQPIATRASTLEWRPKGSKFVDAIGHWAPAYVWNASLNPMQTGAASIVDRCPYGERGNRLWVRETFALWPEQGEGEGPGIAFRADDVTFEPMTSYWRPSIYMPRWASRIILEITEVRVERLQAISEADKLAEGATPEVPFGTVWRKINTKPGIRWDDSPWVWAISFRRIGGGE